MSVNMSTADFIAHQARMSKGKPEVPRKGYEYERETHKIIHDECTRRGWLYFHGSMAHKAMRTIGEPDYTILADGGRVFFVECKSKTGKLSSEQLGLQMVARRLGHEIHVVRTLGDFLEVIDK